MSSGRHLPDLCEALGCMPSTTNKQINTKRTKTVEWLICQSDLPANGLSLFNTVKMLKVWKVSGFSAEKPAQFPSNHGFMMESLWTVPKLLPSLVYPQKDPHHKSQASSETDFICWVRKLRQLTSDLPLSPKSYIWSKVFSSWVSELTKYKL